MNIESRHFPWVAGVLGALLAAAGPALAEGHGGGGHAGGGGHFGGGGSHAAASHFSGGGHYAAAGGHYAGGARAYAGGGVAREGYGAGFHGSAYGGRGGYASPGGGAYHHTYSTGGYWGGGYWRGGYWPRVNYGFGYSWFLPVLPLAYATYWYGGIPYYYANDVYYTWNPAYDGYTATDPPPAADPGADGSAAPPPGADAGAPQDAPAAAPQQPQPQGSAQVFMYPKNGQSEAQQATDKIECEKWASDQVGLGSNGPDYRRALIACVQGRGYSAN